MKHKQNQFPARTLMLFCVVFALLFFVLIYGRNYFFNDNYSKVSNKDENSQAPNGKTNDTSIVEHQGLSFVLPSSEWQFRTSQKSQDGKLTAYIYGVEQGVYDLRCKTWYPTISLLYETIPSEMNIDIYANKRLQMQGINSKELEKIETARYPLLKETRGFVAYNPVSGTVAQLVYAKNGTTAVQLVAEYPLTTAPALLDHYALILKSARFGSITKEEAAQFKSSEDVRNEKACGKK